MNDYIYLLLAEQRGAELRKQAADWKLVHKSGLRIGRLRSSASAVEKDPSIVPAAPFSVHTGARTAAQCDPV